jgi:pyruvate formate lyase activating enzyme
MSTEDGPGIRSTVFFKGCPLNCVWCHNPESIRPQMQLHWEKVRCIGCRSCVEACAKGVLTAADSGITINRPVCDSCGACVRACPSTALEFYGDVTSFVDLLPEVLKDEAYFRKSGGGVTLSGGEPTMQPLFAKELLSALRKTGIHTALDTCGQCSWETLAMLLPDLDLVLYDVKEIDPEKHKKFTGVSNTRILENLIGLARAVIEQGRPRKLWIRTPLIPGCTATEENLRGIGAFIREHLKPHIGRWELCTFNNLCIHKYEGLGIDWNFSKTAMLSPDAAERFASCARDSGVDPGIVHLSGPTSLINPEQASDATLHTGTAGNRVC